jgi:hypothetical protein
MACLSDTKHLSQKGLSGVTHVSDTSNRILLKYLYSQDNCVVQRTICAAAILAFPQTAPGNATVGVRPTRPRAELPHPLWHRPVTGVESATSTAGYWPGVLFPACLVFNPKNRHEEESFPLAAIAGGRRFPLPLRAGTPRNAPRAEARFLRRCASIHTKASIMSSIGSRFLVMAVTVCPC